MDTTIIMWVGFNLFVLLALLLDLGVFHKTDHEISYKDAFIWSFIWIIIAVIFGSALIIIDFQKGIDFFTGYIIEKSLSLDNIFVFSVIFSSLAIPRKYQHRVLFWGIIGALLFRALMIFSGIALLQYFHKAIYIFGGFLIVTGIKMLFIQESPTDIKQSLSYRFLYRIIPLTQDLQGNRLWVRLSNQETGKKKWAATPLFGALLLIEASDLVFAIDSVPAILAITTDPFIVYTSNVFAILGLRSLYFFLANAMENFIYLKTGLAFVLVFVGCKMIMMDFYKISSLISLGIIGGIIGTSIAMSIYHHRQNH